VHSGIAITLYLTVMPRKKAATKVVAKPQPAQNEGEILRERIIAYFMSKRDNYERSLTKLEMAIADTGVDTQRIRAEQAMKIRDRIIEVDSDIATIKYISAK
jgi:hypothetical protein